MATCEVVPATLAHAEALAPRMREADRREVEASGGFDPLEALRRALEVSSLARTLLVDGEPAAIAGVAPWQARPGWGVAWLLSGDLVDRHPMAFWRACLRELPGLVSGFEGIANFIDARYERSLRWVARLGARVAREPAPFGKAGLPFYYWELRREDLHHV